MTVKELKKILENVDESMEVYYNGAYNKVNGYYIENGNDDNKALFVTSLNVQPRVSDGN